MTHEGTAKVYKVIVTEELQCDVRVFITNKSENRYLLDAKTLWGLPLGVYRVKGSVQVDDKIITIDETITLSDV